MATTLSCTFHEFKMAGKELLDAADTLDMDQLENGFKAFSLMYLGIVFDVGPMGKSDEFQAPIVLKIVTSTLMEKRPDWLLDREF